MVGALGGSLGGTGGGLALRGCTSEAVRLGMGGTVSTSEGLGGEDRSVTGASLS